jgi:uncharacterized protein (TIGR00255 family)
MLTSMTGFGSGRARVGDEEVSVELRSVNHKFCEVKLRLPRELSSADAVLQKQIKDRIARGVVDALVRRHSTASTASAPVIDLALAREYRQRMTELASALRLPDEITLREIASQPGVLRLEERGVNTEAALEATQLALDSALAALTAMRRVEGEALQRDLTLRLDKIAAEVAQVSQLVPQSVQEHHRRVAARVEELARVGVDPQRLAQEVAFFAERTDVTEEMTRLQSHLQQCRDLIAGNEPAGRKLDFLVQEMHREVNTTGSKSQHAEISRSIVELKSELERLREQVQNVE